MRNRVCADWGSVCGASRLESRGSGKGAVTANDEGKILALENLWNRAGAKPKHIGALAYLSPDWSIVYFDGSSETRDHS